MGCGALKPLVGLGNAKPIMLDGIACRENIVHDRIDGPVVVGQLSTVGEEPDLLVFQKPTSWQLRRRQEGRFYVQSSQLIGTWKVAANTVRLLFEKSARPDDLLAAVQTERQWINRGAANGVQTLDIVEPEVLPDWFAPPLISRRLELETTTTKNFECPVCYFELARFPAGVLRRHSHRVCPHYYHVECGNFMQRQNNGKGRCVICSAAYADVKAMPSLLKDPRGWFAVCDADFGGTLDLQEVEAALGAVLPMNRWKLSVALAKQWPEWDPDGDGTITLAEFLAPKRGLRDWVISNVGSLKANQDEVADEIPSLDTHPFEWFEFWDGDNSGSLEKDEIVRALVRTFCVTEWGDPMLGAAHDMRGIASIVWEELDFHELDQIDFPTFIEPDGLADTFLHNAVYTAHVGDDVDD